MIPGLSGRGILRAIGGAASSGLWGGMKGAARMTSPNGLRKAGYQLMSGLARNRTAVGAAAGALYGASGDDGSFGGALAGAAMGAGMARYGVNFAKNLRGIGSAGGAGKALTVMGAAMRTAGFMRHDAMRARRFIGRTAVSANQGYNKMRAMGGNAVFNAGMSAMSRGLR